MDSETREYLLQEAADGDAEPLLQWVRSGGDPYAEQDGVSLFSLLAPLNQAAALRLLKLAPASRQDLLRALENFPAGKILQSDKLLAWLAESERSPYLAIFRNGDFPLADPNDDSWVLTPLEASLLARNTRVFRSLSEQLDFSQGPGLDPNFYKLFPPALLAAVLYLRTGDSGPLLTLLRAGADNRVQVEDKSRPLSLLDIACLHNDLETIAALREYGVGTFQEIAEEIERDKRKLFLCLQAGLRLELEDLFVVITKLRAGFAPFYQRIKDFYPDLGELFLGFDWQMLEETKPYIPAELREDFQAAVHSFRARATRAARGIQRHTTEALYRPGGQGYLKAKERFETARW